MLNRRRFIEFSLVMGTLAVRTHAFAAGKSIRLGTVPVVSTRTAYEIYAPLIEYLKTGLELSAIQLETPPNFKSMYQRIREDGFDLLISPPHIARLAQKRLGWHPLVMFQPEHQSVLLVQMSNGPSSLEALRGGTIALHDSSALVVMVMMEALSKKGLQVNRDFKIIETRSYESSQIAVKQGVAQAMIFRSQGFIDASMREHFKVIFEAGVLPGYVMIASPNTARQQLQKMRAQLLAFGNTPEAKLFLEKLGYDAMTSVTEDNMRRLDPFLEATESRLK